MLPAIVFAGLSMLSSRAGVGSSFDQATSPVIPADLRVGGMVSPRTASCTATRFSWHLNGVVGRFTNGMQQHGYEVEAYVQRGGPGGGVDAECTSAAAHRALHSGLVTSRHPYHQFNYTHKQVQGTSSKGSGHRGLAPSTEHCWRVRIIDSDGRQSQWSHWATFATSAVWTNASKWIHGPFVVANAVFADGRMPTTSQGAPLSQICATSNGCTNRAALHCIGNGVIAKITYASYGGVEKQCPTPQGTNCSGVSESHAAAVVSKMCVGKSSCVVPAKPSIFGAGGQGCPGNNNVMVLATAECSVQGRRGGLVRTEVALPTSKAAAIVSATAAVSALGYFELHCNGRRVGPGRLEPGRSGRPNNQNGGGSHRVFYTTYDLSKCLHGGVNMVGARLGNGWFSADGWQPGGVGAPPMFRFQANITLSNGEHVSVVSDSSWMSTPGSITSNSVYMGEQQDHSIARALKGWDGAPDAIENGRSSSSSSSTFAAPLWKPVQVADSGWNGNIDLGDIVMTAQDRPSVVETVQLPALTIHAIPTPVDPLSFTPTYYAGRASLQGAVSYVVDFGQVFSGVVRLTVKSSVDTQQTVVVRHAELLQHPPFGPVDGTPYYRELVNAQATEVHSVPAGPSVGNNAGTGNSSTAWVLEPRFTIHGFRYAIISGLGSPPDLADVVGVVLGADVDLDSSLVFSNPTLNKVQHAATWSNRGNLMDIPTDCNQRDERLGWMGDAALSVDEMLFNNGGGDAAATYVAWMGMIADEQAPNAAAAAAAARGAVGASGGGGGDGWSVPDIVPTVPELGFMEPSDPSWGTAFVAVPFTLWQHTGNLDVVSKYLVKIVAYVDGLAAEAKASGFTKMMAKYADWFPPPNIKSGHASKPFVSSSALVHDVQMTLKMVQAVGDPATIARYTTLEKWAVSTFNKAWYSSSNGTYAGSHQTELAQALALGTPSTAAANTAVAASLVNQINNVDGGHLSTGIVGTRFLFDALSMTNNTALALKLIMQPTYPSFGWMVGNEYEPATTLWEQWDAAMHAVEDYEDASRNHVMFGSVSSWFWRVLAGISPTKPGFEAVRVAPLTGVSCSYIAKLYEVASSPGSSAGTVGPNDRSGFDGLLRWVSGRMRTVRGFVSAAWRFDGATIGNQSEDGGMRSSAMHVNVSVPITASGTVALPCAADRTVSVLGATTQGDATQTQLWPRDKTAASGDGIGNVAVHADGSTVEVEVSSGTYTFVVSENNGGSVRAAASKNITNSSAATRANDDASLAARGQLSSAVRKTHHGSGQEQQQHQRFTVCGHSSGGTMASNHFMAFSDRVLGLGQIESGAYARDRTAIPANITQMVEYSKQSASAGKIAPLSNVAHKPIWVMEGGNDTIAKQMPANSAAFYRLLAAEQTDVVLEVVPHAQHGFVTDKTPTCASCAPCGLQGYMVQECGYDMVKALYELPHQHSVDKTRGPWWGAMRMPRNVTRGPQHPIGVSSR